LNENIFKDYVLEKLPREDDQQLFEEFLKVYQEGGKEALVKHLKGMIADLEG
jgi:hypothetical protein